MSSSRSRWFFLATLLTWQASALAGLGATAPTAVDHEAVQGSTQRSATAQYTIDTTTNAAGSVVSEYSSTHGVVFAVTWRGSTPPNLQQLLDNYFDQYRNASQAHTGDHHHTAVTQGDLKVQAVAHSRYYQGRAWVTSLVPAGVSINDLP